MQTDVGIKLLELTRQKRRLDLDELAEQIHSLNADELKRRITQLSEKGFVASKDGLIELDTRHRISIAQSLIQDGCDPLRISRLLGWQEFEDFAAMTLKQNAFKIAKHFVFKTRGSRREIDLVAWNDTFLLAIDCKHWLRGLSPSQARKVGNAQAERAAALAQRPDLLVKVGVENPEKRRVVPVILCLGDPRSGIVDGIPVVAVSKLISFLYGVSPVDERIRMIPVSIEAKQVKLS
jgi:Holliday junction resolvase-like predicted endonuclease